MEIQLLEFEDSPIFIRNGHEVYLDPIRNKFIPKTKEEEVRQRFINFLNKKIGVPLNMIEVEVPMSHFVKGKRGRADIVIYALNKKENVKYPVIIVECKAWDFILIDDVFNQVYQYEDILSANTIMVTNGSELFIESWNEESEKYLRLQTIPSYMDLVLNNKLDFVCDEKFIYHKKKFEDFLTNETIEFYHEGIFGEETPPELFPMIINLNELLWEDHIKFPHKYLNQIKIIEDIGIRFTSFGNASGGKWISEYRSFIIEDSKGDNQIVSLAIIGGYLVVAIDDYKKSHNSLQYNLISFTKVQDNTFYFHHNGRLALGNKGGMKWAEVIAFVHEQAPELVESPNRIYLGSVKCDKDFTWHQEDLLCFLGNVIKYALIRDEYRDYKLKELLREQSIK
jgi:hypothetical protein